MCSDPDVTALSGSAAPWVSDPSDPWFMAPDDENDPVAQGLSHAAQAQLEDWVTAVEVAANAPTADDVEAAVGSTGEHGVRFGVGLATVLAQRPDPGRLSTGELIDHIDGWARVTAYAQARQGAAVAELFARREAEQEAAWASKDPRVAAAAQDPVRVTCAEVALALRQSPRVAEMVLDDALSLGARPATAAALGRGRIDLATVRAICSEMAVTRPADRDVIEAAALAKALAGGTARQVRLFVRRTAMKLDPGAVAARSKAARSDRGVSKTEVLDDMGELRATMTALELKAVWDTLTTRANALPGTDAAGRHVALDDRRVDVLVDMILNPTRVRDCTHTDQSRWRTDLVITAATAAGRDEGPADLVGYGMVTATTARRIATASTMRTLAVDPDGQVLGRGVTRHHPAPPQQPAPAATALDAGADAAVLAGRVATLLTRASAETNETLRRVPPQHRSTDRYRPTAAIADQVEAVHRRCRFPGCGRPSSGCDLDHAKAHSAGGVTCICNLVPLCRRHHLVKHTDGWSITLNPDRSVTWTTPTHHRYRDPPPRLWE